MLLRSSLCRASWCLIGFLASRAVRILLCSFPAFNPCFARLPEQEGVSLGSTGKIDSTFSSTSLELRSKHGKYNICRVFSRYISAVQAIRQSQWSRCGSEAVTTQDCNQLTIQSAYVRTYHSCLRHLDFWQAPGHKMVRSWCVHSVYSAIIELNQM